MQQIKLGFIGFGEAAYGISKGLKADGLEKICAYDAFYNKEPAGTLIRKRADEVGVVLLESAQALADECTIG